MKASKWLIIHLWSKYLVADPPPMDQTEWVTTWKSNATATRSNWTVCFMFLQICTKFFLRTILAYTTRERGRYGQRDWHNRRQWVWFRSRSWYSVNREQFCISNQPIVLSPILGPTSSPGAVQWTCHYCQMVQKICTIATIPVLLFVEFHCLVVGEEVEVVTMLLPFVLWGTKLFSCVCVFFFSKHQSLFSLHSGCNVTSWPCVNAAFVCELQVGVPPSDWTLRRPTLIKVGL